MMSWVLNVGCISEPGKHTGRPAQLRGEGTPGPQSVTPNPKEQGKGTGGNTAPPGLRRHQPATLLETFHPEQRPGREMTAWPGQEQDRKSKDEGLRRSMNRETVSPSGKWGDSEGEKRPIHRAAVPTHPLGTRLILGARTEILGPPLQGSDAWKVDNGSGDLSRGKCNDKTEKWLHLRKIDKEIATEEGKSG